MTHGNVMVQLIHPSRFRHQIPRAKVVLLTKAHSRFSCPQKGVSHHSKLVEIDWQQGDDACLIFQL